MAVNDGRLARYKVEITRRHTERLRLARHSEHLVHR